MRVNLFNLNLNVLLSGHQSEIQLTETTQCYTCDSKNSEKCLNLNYKLTNDDLTNCEPSNVKGCYEIVKKGMYLHECIAFITVTYIKESTVIRINIFHYGIVIILCEFMSF